MINVIPYITRKKKAKIGKEIIYNNGGFFKISGRYPNPKIKFCLDETFVIWITVGSVIANAAIKAIKIFIIMPLLNSMR